MSRPCAPLDGNAQCTTPSRSGKRATSTIDGSRMQRNSRSAAPSVTHQRGRPGRSIARWLPSLRPNRCSVGVLRSSPMQAAIPTPLRLTIAAPFGRGPHWNTARVLNVAASSHATLAEPRLVARTSPSSATAPATPPNPGNVAMCRWASWSITSMQSRAVCAMKTRRVFGSNAAWSNSLFAALGISMMPSFFSGMTAFRRVATTTAYEAKHVEWEDRPCAISSKFECCAELGREAVSRGVCVSPCFDPSNAELDRQVAILDASIFRPVRVGPFARVPDRVTGRQDRSQFFCRRQDFHPLSPSAERRKFRIHRPGFFGQAEGKGARQNEEVGKRQLGAEQIVLSMRQLAFHHAERQFDLGQRMRHYFLIRRDAELGKHQPLMRDVIDHVGVVVGIDCADPLVHSRASAHILRRQPRPGERLVDVRSDGAGLIDSEITMLEDRHTVERMQCEMLRLAHHLL